MYKRSRLHQQILLLIILALASSAAIAQKKHKSAINYSAPSKQAVLWHPVDVGTQDLFKGPGGNEMTPDLSNITFIERDTKGHNKKYRIKDGSGREWVAKLGSEARPETAAVRLLSGLGYETEINYLVPQLTIPGVG